MSTLTAWHLEVKNTLEAAFTVPDSVQFGPAENLPRDGEGRVAQCAVLWPTTGDPVSRNGAPIHQRNDAVAVVFVGPTILDALAAVGKGRKALQGARLIASGPGGGQVREGGFTGAQPAPEPGTDPVRVSLSIRFDAATKEPE